MIEQWFNTIIKFLAARDLESLSKENLMLRYNRQEIDLIILLGNSSIRVAETAALAFKNGLTSKIMICGGKGHSTPFLYENIRKSPIYHGIQTEGKSEAEIFKTILTDFHGIREESLLLETHSTNCGSNAIEALKILGLYNLHPENILIMQDPVLQKRSEASFQKVFHQEKVNFISYASFVPFLIEKEGRLTYKDKSSFEFCDLDRFISLVMGEIPRLLNNETGYGPKGKNYIVDVTIPEEVSDAFQNLLIALDGQYKLRT
jgi:uncharacterized SAM-binding protein YcdF (DUF218 family)